MAPAPTGASATIRTTTAANGTQTRLRADDPAIGENIIAFPLSPRSLPRDRFLVQPMRQPEHRHRRNCLSQTGVAEWLELAITLATERGALRGTASVGRLG